MVDRNLESWEIISYFKIFLVIRFNICETNCNRLCTTVWSLVQVCGMQTWLVHCITSVKSFQASITWNRTEIIWKSFPVIWFTVPSSSWRWYFSFFWESRIIDFNYGLVWFTHRRWNVDSIVKSQPIILIGKHCPRHCANRW